MGRQVKPPEEHLVSIKEFAEIVDEGLNNVYLWAAIRDNNIPLLEHFDKTKVALNYLKLIQSQKRSNFISGCTTGTLTNDVLHK